MEWIEGGKSARYKVSVCGGAMILAEAGYLTGKKATTNRNVLKSLESYAAEVLKERVVDEGDIITAGGVSSSLDLGLYLVHKIAGPEVMEKIRTQMEYNGFQYANIQHFGEPIKIA
jgi:transcriptional regulator GlxA family with amidase domain